VHGSDPPAKRRGEKSLDEAYANLLEVVRYSNDIIDRSSAHEAECVRELTKDIRKVVKKRQGEALVAFHAALASLTETKVDIPGCPICHCTYVEVRAVKPQFCGHIMCDACYEKLVKSECPHCRKELGEAERVYV
jgi:hypothetical protein